jgi:hypothetical protein
MAGFPDLTYTGVLVHRRGHVYLSSVSDELEEQGGSRRDPALAGRALGPQVRQRRGPWPGHRGLLEADPGEHGRRWDHRGVSLPG